MRRLGYLILGAFALASLVVAWVTQPLLATGSPIAAAGRADPARLERIVRHLSVSLANRHFDKPATLRRAAAFLGSELAATGAAVRMQDYEVGGEKYANVIARFGPPTGAPIVIGAHYDAEEDTAGADDNASGVAGLLELARLLAGRPLPVPVELVAYTLEEPPSFRTDEMGSRRHAKSLVEAGTLPRLVLVLEMIGYFDDREGSQDYPLDFMRLFYPTRGDFVAVVGNLHSVGTVRSVKRAMLGATDLPVRSINAPEWMPGVDFSDHASYWLHGMPAVMVTDTAFYRNHHYHTPQDTFDRLDYRRMAKVVDAINAVVTEAENEV